MEISATHRNRVSEFQKKHRIGFLTLVFTDIVGSTKIKSTLGDAKAIPLIHRHHAKVREIIAQFEEVVEIETAGDSFLIACAKPSDAVKFSLYLQAATREMAAETGYPVLDRIGIHVGEVWIQENVDAAKAIDLYGVQVDTAARVQSLGDADQILMTRSVFDGARPVLKAAELEGVGAISWLNYGPYRMKGVEEPIEVCEVGERGKAKLEAPADTEKARRVFTGDAELVPGWRPAIDQEVPGTSWVLERKLGEGGFGEVWLGRDKVLKSAHVFKFCIRADRVRSLKREVTLFRLIREKMGDHPNIVAIERVNFDEAPYYIVMPYVDGSDLAAWWAKSGGTEKIDLPARLEIVAQVADALEAAHECGIVHRDVKPSNVLISSAGNGKSGVRCQLTDFGIGSVETDAALGGMTRLGFTQTITGDSSRSGTILYMAPEVAGGKPASTQSDIYALGVILFQLIVGDFERAISSDWPRRIEDPFLREDLEKCLSGDPKERFATPGELAKHLRGLEERRAAFKAEEAARRAREAAVERAGTMRLAGIACALCIGVVAALHFCVLPFHRVEDLVRDLIVQYCTQRAAVDPRLVYLALDEQTMNVGSTVAPGDLAASPALKEMAQGFPWRRDLYAMLIDRLMQAGAKVVALDILITSPRDGDAALKASLDNYRNNVVIAGKFSDGLLPNSPRTYILPSSDLITDGRTDPRVGYVNLWPSADGVVRRVKYRISGTDALRIADDREEFYSFPARVLQEIGYGPAIRDGDWFLHFAAPRDGYTVKPISVYTLFVPAMWKADFDNGAFFKDKIVVVGLTADAGKVPTPVGMLDATELRLNAINDGLHGDMIAPPTDLEFLVMSVAMGLAAFGLATAVNRPLLLVGFFPVVSAALLFFTVVSYDCFRSIIPFLGPVLVLNVSGAVILFAKLLREREDTNPAVARAGVVKRPGVVGIPRRA